MKFASVLIKLSVVEWVVSDESQESASMGEEGETLSICVFVKGTNGKMFDL